MHYETYTASFQTISRICSKAEKRNLRNDSSTIEEGRLFWMKQVSLSYRWKNKFNFENVWILVEHLTYKMFTWILDVKYFKFGYSTIGIC